MSTVLNAATRLRAAASVSQSKDLGSAIILSFKSLGVISDPSMSGSRGAYYIQAFKAGKALASKGVGVHIEYHCDAESTPVKHILHVAVVKKSAKGKPIKILRQDYSNLTLPYFHNKVLTAIEAALEKAKE